ncbi:TPA: TetR/AcrR family transcriptional regulator [Clostridioides difficile]
MSFLGRKKEPDNTIQKILDISHKLFLEKGYEQTTIQDIVDNLDGLSRGAIYHHFKSKDEIIKAITSRLYSDGFYGYDVKNDEGKTALGKLQYRLLHAYEQHNKQDIFLMSSSLLRNPKYLATQFDEIINDIVPWIKALIEEGNQDNSMQVKNPEIAAQMFGFLLNTWCIPTVYPGNPQQMIERFTLFGEQAAFMGISFMNDKIMCEYQKFVNKFSK